MKHIWKKSFVYWQVNGILYVSIPFTWLVNEAICFIKKQNAQCIVGGPGAILKKEKFDGIATVQKTIDWCEPLTFHNPLATFTTRGCVNNCAFCAVPKIEGEFREVNNFVPRPIVCDNNFLASSKKHFNRVIDALKIMPWVDFNQGLEARLFTKEKASRLAELKIPNIRFAFDSEGKETYLVEAIKNAKDNGIKTISILMLYGFSETPAEALYRAEFLRSLKVNSIFPMRYQPLNTDKKDKFVSSKWSEYELQRFKAYWVKSWNGVMDNVPYADFEIGETRRNITRGFDLFDHRTIRTTNKYYE